MPVRKKRSVKQLANDKRLGRMAKKRAAAKRTKKTPRRSPAMTKKVAKKSVLRKRQAQIQRNPRRTKRAKSHLWRVFKCKGKSVSYLTMRKGKTGWTFTGGDALFFNTKSQAGEQARAHSKGDGYQYGAAPDNFGAPQIIAGCTPGK